MSLKRVCILSFSNLTYDRRVLRQIEAARQEFEVDVIAYGEWTPPEGVRFFSVKRSDVSPLVKYPLLLGGKFFPGLMDTYFWQKPAYREALAILKRERYDLIHANDWDALPVAGKAVAETGAKMLFDAHEYSLAQNAERPWWRFWIMPFRDVIFHQYGPRASAMTTVSPGLQDLYREHFGWEMTLIRNVPDYTPVAFRPTDPQDIKLVHLGGAMPARALKDFIQMVPLLDSRFTLHLILLPVFPQYLAELKILAEQTAPGRIIFHEPQLPAKLFNYLTQFDVGIPLIRALHDNYQNMLPNKFFDFVMAGLGIVVAPLPMMTPYLEQYGNGIAAAEQDYHAVADVLNALTAGQVDAFKHASLKMAKEVNAGVEMARLMEMYHKILDL